MIRLIGIDVDGTLLDSHGALPPENAAAIHEAAAAGIHVALVTGRSYPFARPVADPLPAGFEIENPNLLAGSGVADLSWLTVDEPAHFEARTDQYVAAFRFTSSTASVTTAYLARAVTPGTFVLPGATVEDMYRPELRGNTDAGQIEVSAVGP